MAALTGRKERSRAVGNSGLVDIGVVLDQEARTIEATVEAGRVKRSDASIRRRRVDVGAVLQQETQAVGVASLRRGEERSGAVGGSGFVYFRVVLDQEARAVDASTITSGVERSDAVVGRRRVYVGLVFYEQARAVSLALETSEVERRRADVGHGFLGVGLLEETFKFMDMAREHGADHIAHRWLGDAFAVTNLFHLLEDPSFLEEVLLATTLCLLVLQGLGKNSPSEKREKQKSQEDGKEEKEYGPAEEIFGVTSGVGRGRSGGERLVGAGGAAGASVSRESRRF